MKDILTHKRVKVNYERMIKVLGLSYDFTSYLFQNKTSISIRRSALAYLRKRRVKIRVVHMTLEDHPEVKNYIDFLTICCGGNKEIFKECCFQ